MVIFSCSESDNDFLETCRASTLLAELEDDDELPEPDDDDDEDDDENEDGNEDEDEEYEEVMVRNFSIQKDLSFEITISDSQEKNVEVYSLWI